MDPLSHAIVGGTAVMLACREPKQVRVAAVCGMLSAMAPDLDVLIRSAQNPLLGIEYHRFFTHALVFAPLGGLVCAAALWGFLKKRLRFGQVFLYCLIGFATHGLLDAMTNYGTHLFWPFAGRRESWSVISIVDPIFTLVTGILLFLTLRKRARRPALFAAMFASCYWSLGLYQKHSAIDAMFAQAAARGHAIERFEVKPSLGNLIVWRGQYLHGGQIHVDAYRVAPWARAKAYAGGSAPLYSLERDFGAVQNSDFEKFAFFADGWLAKSPSRPGLIGDARFAASPRGLEPLWGIRLYPDRPQRHVAFESAVMRKQRDASELWGMVLGREIDR